MSQPPIYNRQASFTNLQAINPEGQPPGNTMDAEFNAVKTTLDATLANLKVIQNDDTTLGNATVGPAQLSSQLTVGFTAPSGWATGHAYTASPASTVLQGTGLYICLVSHTSGTFATDLVAGKWLLIFDLSTLTFGTAAQITVAAHASNIVTNVQTSLNNLDDNKAALSHTHTASQISDSTAAGRAMLTAANVGAQQSLLGLGSLAFLNSVAVSTIPAQLVCTGAAIPVVLAADVNDYTPTGWATITTLLQGSSAAVSITGFGATVDGDLKFIQNTGSFNITLVGSSTLSALGNRILTPTPVVLRPTQGVMLRYNIIGGYVGWGALSPATSNPPVGTSRNLRMGNVANYLGDAAPATPNNQVYIRADDLILKDSSGAPFASSVSIASLDGTSQNIANGTDGAYSIGASAWYSIWVIGNASGTPLAGLISTSATAPTLPSGYTHKARVGWMRTDGSSHFLRTLQYGRTARYTGTMPAITGAAGVATVTPSITNYVPPTATKIAVILAGPVAAGQAANVSATASSSPLITVTNATGGGNLTANSIAEFNLEASTISYSSNTAGTAVSCYGWEDSL